MHVYPGPRYQNHLLNEHGVVFDLEFMIQLTLFKKENGKLPEVNMQKGKIYSSFYVIVHHYKENEIVMCCKIEKIYIGT